MDFREIIFGYQQVPKAPSNANRIAVLTMALMLMVIVAWYFGILTPVLAGLWDVIIATWNMLSDFASRAADFLKWVNSQRQ